MDVADFVVERIADWGVDRIYGYPGDGINGVVGAIQHRKNRPRFIQTRHEEAAALMACAEAKWTGHAGICLATSGPGAIHLLNGLYDAKLDHQPVVAIVGQQSRMSLGGAYMQEVDLQSLFKDVASEFVATIVVPEQARHVIDRAFRTALSQRTVTCIIVPNDVQRLEAVEEPPKRHQLRLVHGAALEELAVVHHPGLAARFVHDERTGREAEVVAEHVLGLSRPVQRRVVGQRVV